MDRITKNDTAQMNNTQLSHNQVFIKGGWTIYRDFDKEIDILDLIAQIANKQNVKLDSESKQQFLEELDWALEFQDYADPEHILALLYRAWWSMAEVREHLSAYEDIGLTPQEIQEKLDKLAEYEKTQQEHDNPQSLTLEQLKERDGKPVYIVLGIHLPYPCEKQWAVTEIRTKERVARFYVIRSYYTGDFDDYSKTWLAYDHEPKGE